MQKVKDLINTPYDRICLINGSKGIISDRTCFTEEELKDCLDCDAEIEEAEDCIGMKGEEPVLIVFRTLIVYMEEK